MKPTKATSAAKTGDSFLSSAIALAELGFLVVPATRRNPTLKNWPQVATRDPEQIKKWLPKYADASVAIVIRADSDVWALDADVPNWLMEKWGRKLPKTATVRSGGGGLHVYFRHDDYSRAKLGPLKVNFVLNPDRSSGRDKVLEIFLATHSLQAPGTAHYKTGKLYSWVGDDRSPEVCPREFVDFLISLDWQAKNLHEGTRNSTSLVVDAEAFCYVREDVDIENILEAIGLKKRATDEGFKFFSPVRTECPVSGRRHRGSGASVWVLFYTSKNRSIYFHCDGGSCSILQGKGCRTRDALSGLGLNPDEILASSTAEKIVLGSAPTATLIVECEKLLLQRSNPGEQIFQRAGSLVRFQPHRLLADLERSVVRRPDNSNVIVSLSQHYLFLALSVTGKFYKPNKKGLVRADPDSRWSSMILDRVVTNQENTPWPPLRMYSATPILLPNGEVVSAPGFHEPSGIWLDTGELRFPPVPTRPTREEARRALEKFHTIYHRFDFVTSTGERWNETPSFAAILSTTLSVIVRNLLATVPLLGISAPTVGSGKTLIAESIIGSSTGKPASYMSYDNREEFDKSLFDPLSKGDRVILIDNISPAFQSDRLCTVITARGSFPWRVLGESRNVSLINEAVFIATGNNLAITGELPRRCLLVQLDPNVERPEQRGFDFDPAARARDMFPELVVAALSAVRAFQQAGFPTPNSIKSHLGSFDEWSRIVRSCLVWLGYADSVLTQNEIRAEDPYLAADTELLSTWHLEFGSREVTLREIELSHAAGGTFAILVGQTDGRWQSVRIAARLRRLKGRVLDGYKLTSSIVGVTHGTRWKVEPLGVERGPSIPGPVSKIPKY